MFVLDLIAWAALVVVCMLCNLASGYVITFDLGLTYIQGTTKERCWDFNYVRAMLVAVGLWVVSSVAELVCQC